MPATLFSWALAICDLYTSELTEHEPLATACSSVSLRPITSYSLAVRGARMDNGTSKVQAQATIIL